MGRATGRASRPWPCNRILFLLLAAQYFAATVYAFRAFDCNHDNATTVALDLTEPEQCPDPVDAYEPPEQMKVQVFQMDRRRELHAINCKATVTREVTHCGVGSLSYSTQPVEWEKSLEISPSLCRSMQHPKSTFKFDGQEFSAGIPQLIRYQYYSYGNVTEDGYCETTTFTRNGIKYTGAYEQTFLTLSILTVKGMANPDTNEVVFDNGVRAPLADLAVTDDEMGLMLWRHVSTKCEEELSHVFTGNATVHYSKDEEDHGTLVVINDRNRVAGLVLKESTTVCGHHCYRTQIDQVFACLLREKDAMMPTVAFKVETDQARVSMHTQIGFQHVEMQMTVMDRLRYVQGRVCEVERKTAFNKLQNLSGDRNPHALLDTFGKGHRVVTAGAVAYVTRCIPVEVVRTDWANCTEEIPVRLGNATVFADAFSKVLQTYPTEVVCDEVTPIMWNIHGDWFCSSPSVTPCTAPLKLKLNASAFHYPTLGSGLGLSLYSLDQRRRHQRSMERGSSRRAVVAKFANDMRDRQGDPSDDRLHHGSGRFYVAADPFMVTNLAALIGLTVSPIFRWFGDAGVMAFGALTIISLCNYVLSTLMRMWQIYQVRGCGIFLLAGLWAATAHLVTYPVAALKNWFRFGNEMNEQGIDRINAVADPRTMGVGQESHPGPYDRPRQALAASRGKAASNWSLRRDSLRRDRVDAGRRQESSSRGTAPPAEGVTLHGGPSLGVSYHVPSFSFGLATGRDNERGGGTGRGRRSPANRSPGSRSTGSGSANSGQK